MKPESHPEEAIFTGALALPPSERAAYVAAACQGDDALRQRVETLLRAHEAGASLLQGSPGEHARTAYVRPPAVEQPGTVIDRYKLLQKIGEGGCGIVYMAEQEEPVRRRVALKVIKLGMDTKEVVARFEAERQALAMMDHPNIARVFDGGTTSTGRPYFVMELVRGMPITRYCDENNLPTERRLELFVSVCQAVQHAHQKGIIHRDLKPSNVLVTENDGLPVTKVIDFGIAKATQGRLTDATLFTAFEQFIGTPAYMSPEQAAMTSLDVDTRSDIYSLGVLLYELLTGEPPFNPKKLMAAGFDEIRRLIREVDPPRPSNRLTTLTDADRTTVAKVRGTSPADLSAKLAGDLDWIVMRCLEKDRARRYESASALALDLQHYRNDLPITARPPSRFYVLRKLVARNKLAVGAAAAVTLALITGLVASLLAYYNEKSAHQYAVETSQALQKAMAETLSARTSGGDALRQEAQRSIFALQVMQALVTQVTATPLPAETKERIVPLLTETVERLRHEPQIRPTTKQQLLDSAGDIYLAFGELARAEDAYRQVLSIRRITLGAEHPDSAAAARKLDDVLRRQGKAGTLPAAPPASSATTTAPPSRQYDGSLALRLGRELRQQGRYAEADVQLHKALRTFQAMYGPAPDRFILNEIARLHLEAGDLAGPRSVAQRELAEERCAHGWFRYGFLAGLGITTARGSFNAHSLLGLVALREGRRAEAVQQLLLSARGIVHNPLMADQFEFRAFEIRLASELLQANETVAVLEFLAQIRRSYVEALGARGSTLFANWSWESYYDNSARSRVLEEKLEGWRREILAGNTPAEWQLLIDADRPAVEPGEVQLEAIEPFLAGLPRPPSTWPGVLAPSAFLCLGWLALGLAARPGFSRLPAAAGKPLLALSATRILTCLLFATTFLVGGFQPNGLLVFILTVAGWWLLWGFIHNLAPALVTRRELQLINGLFWLTLLMPLGVRALNFLSKSQWASVAFGLGTFGSLLMALVLVLTICATLCWRLWRWKPENLLGAKIALLLSTPLVALHGLACLSIPLLQEENPDAAILLLWADAALPWLWLAGFIRRTRSSPTPAPQTAGN